MWLFCALPIPICGCVSLRIGNKTVCPTIAQELTELKDSLNSGKLTPQEYEVAKNAVFTHSPPDPSKNSGLSFVNHSAPSSP
jgi:hypothetical protein